MGGGTMGGRGMMSGDMMARMTGFLGDTILVNVDTEEDCLDFEKGERVKDEAEENKKEGEEKVPVEAAN